MLLPHVLYQLVIIHATNSFKSWHSRMFGGERADISKNPWHVQICLQQFELKKNHCDSVMCGGALVKLDKSRKIVLTAAHCVSSQGRVLPKNDVNLYIGSDKPSQGSKLGVKKIVIHPKFDIATTENDIAILILPPNRYPKNIHGILLPKVGEKTPPKSKHCKVSGFGTHCEAGHRAEEMQQLSMSHISANDCLKNYGDQDDIKNGFVFCAGSNDHGRYLYDGDSGGPYVCLDVKSEHRLYGIVSSGSNCNETNVPTLFVNVAKYLHWINRVVKDVL